MLLSPPQNILICRTDNLGDVMLTLPICGFLKSVWPEVHIGFVGKAYTIRLLAGCKYVDRIWDREEVLSNAPDWQTAQYDVALFIFPDKELAWSVKRKGIKYRVGTSHRWWHWLSCNIRPDFTRKGSDQHEAMLNFELIKPILPTSTNTQLTLNQLSAWYGFKPTAAGEHNYRALTIKPERPFVVLHPKSAGSAREWPLSAYQELAKALVAIDFQVVVTGIEKEGQVMQAECPALFELTGVINLCGKLSLAGLVALIAKADGLVACSTGPLHIGAALGIPVVGIYPPIKPMHPGRWAPIGQFTEVLVLDKSCEDCRKTEACSCIRSIEVWQVKQALLNLQQARLQVGQAGL